MANQLNSDRGKAISVGSSTMRNQDLRHDLNNRQTEDMRTRIERHRERHRREDRDDDIVEGCLALAPEFRQVVWPKKFKIDVLRYNGTTNPRDFLQLYSLAAAVAGADGMMMTIWFPLALKGDAQTWLLNLPKCSIRSWRTLKEQFLGAFQGGYKRPGAPSDLHDFKQLPGETLRKFIQRFT